MKFFQQVLLSKLLFFILSSSSAFSKEIDLIKVSNESDTDTMIIGVSVNNEDFIESLYIDYFHERERVAFKRLLIKNDFANKEVKVYTRKKRDIIILESSNFNPYRGGELVINYLHNAITGNTKKLKLDLGIKDGWHMYKGNKEIRAIHLKSKRTFLIGEIGIEDIVIKYKKGKK